MSDEKIININASNAQALTAIAEAAEEAKAMIEVKQSVLETILESAQAMLETSGLKVDLHLSEEGHDFMLADIDDYIVDRDFYEDDDDEDEDEDDDFDEDEDEDDEDEDFFDSLFDDVFDDVFDDIERFDNHLFEGTDADGYRYVVGVEFIYEDDEDEEDEEFADEDDQSFVLQIAVMRAKDDEVEILSEEGWLDLTEED